MLNRVSPIPDCDLDRVYRHASPLAETDGVGSRKVVLALSVPEAVPVALDGSALAIWLAIDGQRTVRQISEDVAALYGVTSSAIIGDIVRTIDDFSVQHLVDLVARFDGSSSTG